MIDLSNSAQLGRYIRQDGKSKHQLMRKTMADCHKHWSTIIRKRDKYTCQWCGSTKKTQAHHIIAQGICSIIARYDKRNGMTLCYACHIHRLKIDPDGYIVMRDAWLKMRGLNYAELRILFCAKSKITVQELDILKDELERESNKVSNSGQTRKE